MADSLERVDRCPPFAVEGEEFSSDDDALTAEQDRILRMYDSDSDDSDDDCDESLGNPRGEAP